MKSDRISWVIYLETDSRQSSFLQLQRRLLKRLKGTGTRENSMSGRNDFNGRLSALSKDAISHWL